MAGMEDEDEFRDADDGADAAPPPSPSPASSPSKPKPAAAAGGFGRRLLASIGLPTSFSAVIGRSAAPSGPRPSAPQPPVGPNLGLGLLLAQGSNPSADGSLVPDASARGLHLPPTGDLQKRQREVRGERGAAEDGEDRVIRRDAGAGEELAVLVPEEEGKEKEDAADGCSGNRDLDEEVDQYQSDELEPAMEDQEVIEQEGATEYYNAVEDQSNSDAEQCIGDAPAAIKDDRTVEEKDEVMEQGCGVGIVGVAEYGVAVGLEEEDGLLEGKCEDAISVQDQHKVVEQCWNDESGVTMGDSWVNDLEEVVVGQGHVTEHSDSAVEGQSNNAALEQRPSDELGVIKDANAVEDKEKVVEKNGAICILGAAEDGIAVGLQKEDVVVEDQGDEDDIPVHDQDNQHKVVEQCMGDELGVPMGDSAVHDSEVVVVEQGITEHFYAAVEDQIDNAALEHHTSDDVRVIKEGTVLEDEEKVVEQEAAIDILGVAKDGIAVGLREEDVVVEGQGEHGISLQDYDKVVEQGMRYELGVSIGDDSNVHDQEVVVMVEQEWVGECFDAAMKDQCNNAAMEQCARDDQCTSDELGVEMGGSIIQDQDLVADLEEVTEYFDAMVEDQSNNAAAADQCTHDKSKALRGGNIVEVKEKAVQQVVVDMFCAAKDPVAVQSQEKKGMVVVGQGEDGISIQYQHKVVEQCINDKLEGAKGDSTAQDQEVVEKQEGITEYFYAALEDQSSSAPVTQFITGEPSEVKDGNIVETKSLEQSCEFGILGAAENSVALDLQGEDNMVVEGHDDGIFVQDQHQVVEQCISDDLRVSMGDSLVQNQEVAVLDQGVTRCLDASVEDMSNNCAVVQCTSGELEAATDDNFVEEKERAVVEEGAIAVVALAKDDHTLVSQEEREVVAKQGEGVGSLQDQYKAVEQCTSDQVMRTATDAAHDQEVVGQERATYVRVATVDDISIDAQEKAVGQSADDESSATKGTEEMVVNQGLIQKQDAIKGVSALELQEDEDVAVKVEGEGGISIPDQDMVVEQEGALCVGVATVDDIAVDGQEKAAEQSAGDESSATKGTEEKVVDQVNRTATDAAHDQEVVGQERAICVRVATVDDIAIDAQEKAVEQSADDESSATKGTEEMVVNQGLIQKQDAIKGGGAFEPQEDEDVAVKEEGDDGISIRDQDKVVEQCSNDQWGTTMDDNAAEDQEVRREKIRLSVVYPQRPGRSNCRVYMSTGSCPYGLSCYLNHPQVSSPQLKTKREVPSFASEQGNREVAQILELNRVGLPIRENARNCMYYMRNGACGYGKRCCYNHPEHVLDVQVYKPTGWDDTNVPSSPHSKKSSSPHSKKSSEHANLDDISSSSEILPPNILRMLLPPQTMPPGTEVKGMKVKKDPDWSSASDDSDGCCSADSSGGPLCKQEHHVDYPEKPGRPECPFFLKYGNCRFGSSCHYYHPNDKYSRNYRRKDPSLSEEMMVYPDRPGEPECPFYMKTGACKFRAECKFHHPKDLSLSMQDLTIPKGLVDAKEPHPETKTPPQDHMDRQQNYPERPGQPECRYYMQFGTCKFQSACIFHHPKDRVRAMPECPFYMKTGSCQFGSACEFYHPRHRSSIKGGENDDGTEYGHGYPERPGGNECFHYMQYGYCKFQMNCKYHHPADRLSRK